MKEMYSFDIFDTCLVRACGSPNCIAGIVASHILRNTTPSAINDFILKRKEGEGRARSLYITAQKEDITIEDIYSQCDFTSLTDVTNESIMEMEMAVETNMLIPVLSVKKEIERLHSQGHSVIFISDMYLPTAFLRGILINTGFFREGDQIFISGDIGKAKSTGNLFDYVQKTIHIDVKRWHHKGDSKHSDYDMPRRRGINATLIQHRRSFYEQNSINYGEHLSSSDITKATAIARAIRLSFPDTPHYRFAADFIAPMMTTYVHHILKDASLRNIEHLYFMARDAYILYCIAQELHSLYPAISLHYLYGSRQSLYLPGLTELTDQSLKEVMPEYYGNTDSIRSFYEEQSKLCIDYLCQEGVNRPHSAIVDMIGGRKCQISINNILRRNGYEPVFAYYFEVTPYRVMAPDAYLAMYYQERMAGSPYYHHASHPLFEQYFGITDQQRTKCYQKEGDKIVPVFESDLVRSDYKNRVFAINKEVCCAYAKYYSQVFISNPELCNNTFYRVFAHFCHVPHREYLMALDQFFSTSSETTQESLLVKRSLYSILFNKKQYLRWKNGNLIYNSGILYRPMIALLEWYYNRKIKRMNQTLI